MLNKLLFSIILFSCPLVLVAAPEDAFNPKLHTPREAFSNAETLFVNGHLFLESELDVLNDLRSALDDADEGDLSLRLSSLILASKIKKHEVQKDQAGQEPVDSEYNHIVSLEDQNKDKEHWKVVRNMGLFMSISGTASAFICGTAFEINNIRAHNSYYSSDGDFYKRQADFFIAASGVSMGVALFGLIPLLTAEGHLSQ